jgi:hypothetical protein
LRQKLPKGEIYVKALGSRPARGHAEKEQIGNIIMLDPHSLPTGRDAQGPDSARDARGRFQPGQSGNPAGKKPGTQNHATRLKLLLDDPAYDKIARQTIEAATGGHWPAVRFLMERLVPRPRSREITVDLPAGASKAERLTALVDLMFAGEISPDEAKAMIAVLDRVEREVASAARRQPAPAEPPPSVSPEAALDLHSACISDAARAPTLRSQLLHSTCISSPDFVMPGLDPGIVTGAAAAAARAAVAMAGSSPAMTGKGSRGLKRAA